MRRKCLSLFGFREHIPESQRKRVPILLFHHVMKQNNAIVLLGGSCLVTADNNQWCGPRRQDYLVLTCLDRFPVYRCHVASIPSHLEGL